jgi:hypothetical protein
MRIILAVCCRDVFSRTKILQLKIFMVSLNFLVQINQQWLKNLLGCSPVRTGLERSWMKNFDFVLSEKISGLGNFYTWTQTKTKDTQQRPPKGHFLSYKWETCDEGLYWRLFFIYSTYFNVALLPIYIFKKFHRHLNSGPATEKLYLLLKII